MSYIPDCRTDEDYNEKYLDEVSKQFVAGYDYAIEQVVNLFEGNSVVYPELFSLLDKDTAIVNVDKAKIVSDAVKDWTESARNELITSMIDNMNDAEYDDIRAKVDGNGNL